MLIPPQRRSGSFYIFSSDNKIKSLIYFFIPYELHITRLVDPVEIG
jgi:hypothetical protein